MPNNCALLFASFSDVSTSSKNINAPSPKSFIISDQFTFKTASNNQTTQTSDSVETTQTSNHEFCGHDEETSGDDELSNREQSNDTSKGVLLKRKQPNDVSLLNREQSNDTSKGVLLKRKQPNDASGTIKVDNKFLSVENEDFDDDQTPEPT